MSPTLGRALALLVSLSKEWDVVGLKGDGNGEDEQRVIVTFRRKKAPDA